MIVDASPHASMHIPVKGAARQLLGNVLRDDGARLRALPPLQSRPQFLMVVQTQRRHGESVQSDPTHLLALHVFGKRMDARFFLFHGTLSFVDVRFIAYNKNPDNSVQRR